MSGMMKSLSVVVMPTHMLPERAAAPGTMTAYFDQIEVRLIVVPCGAPYFEKNGKKYGRNLLCGRSRDDIVRCLTGRIQGSWQSKQSIDR